MTRVRRGALAGIFALALAVAGLLAAAVASGARPLSVLTTTGTTGATTTTPAPSIAAGVTIGGVPVGGLTAADAYDAVNESFSQPTDSHLNPQTSAPWPGSAKRSPEREALCRERKSRSQSRSTEPGFVRMSVCSRSGSMRNRSTRGSSSGTSAPGSRSRSSASRSTAPGRRWQSSARYSAISVAPCGSARRWFRRQQRGLISAP